jgi:hypothetical protein
MTVILPRPANSILAIGRFARRFPAFFLIMKTRFLHVALVLSLVLPLAPALRAQAQHQHKEPETELGKLMEKVGKSWRSVRKQVDDPASNAATLELVAGIHANLDRAVALEPARAQDVPEAERAKYIESFRSHLKEFIGMVGELEAALKANDNAAAAALVKQLGAAQREDHKEFRRPDE